MKKSYLTISILVLFNLNIFSQTKLNRKLKYRQYEMQTSQSLTINVGDGGLSGLTIDRRYIKSFSNQLPSREDFKPEVKRSMRRVK